MPTGIINNQTVMLRHVWNGDKRESNWSVQYVYISVALDGTIA